MHASLNALVTLALATLLATPTNALPVNTQSCHATQNPNIGDALFSDLLNVEWQVDVGVPFKNGNGCSAIESALRAAVGDTFENFLCDADDDLKGGGGGTALSFDGNSTPGVGQRINAALTSVFPPIMGGFNCPDS